MESPLPYRCVIQGVGGYLPEMVMSNAELSARFHLDTSNEWIQERTGILQRHVASPDEKTSDLAFFAANSALTDAQLDPNLLDLIIVATSTADRMFPATATIVQNKLGSKNAISFDLNAACSGFLFALVMAESYLMQSGKTHALVIGSETMTRLTNKKDRGTAILFGDGAGAVVISRIPSRSGILGHCLFSDGKNGKAIDDLHVTTRSPEHPLGFISMNGQAVFREATEKLKSSTEILLHQQQIDLESVDWIIPHQANKRILDYLRKDLHISPEKMLYSGDLHANTSAASIPLTWWKARQVGKILPGQLLLLQAFGAGYTWGSCLVRV
jgi:3-oxoacyl-[acyl-carrier-protein] synthase-3